MKYKTHLILLLSLTHGFLAFGDKVAIERYGEPFGVPKNTACIARDSEGNKYFIRWDKSNDNSLVSVTGGILRSSIESACVGSGAYAIYWVAPRWLGKDQRFRKNENGEWTLTGPNILKKEHLGVAGMEPTLDEGISIVFRATTPPSLELNKRLKFSCDGGCER